MLTIGNFDGVHLAHQQAAGPGRGSCPPSGCDRYRHHLRASSHQVSFPCSRSQTPHTLCEKSPAHRPSGIDLLVVLPFNRELAHLSPLEFVRNILVQPLHTVAVHVGPNFRFGYRQSGDVEILEEFGRQEGFKVEVLPLLEVRGQTVSSTRIRELLVEGRVHLANRLLGRPFSAYGPIVAGLGVGRKHTVPTLNLAPGEEQLPKTGVYVTRTSLGN